MRLTALAAVLVMMLAFTGCHSGRTASRTNRPVPSHLSKSDISGLHPVTAKLLAEADSWIGTPYKAAGTDRKGVDCSGLARSVFQTALSISLPRNSAAQAEWCSPVRKSDLIAGDLVFFSSGSSKSVGHVGIYVGDGRMIHASPRQGVVMVSIDSYWFAEHYHGGGRVTPYYAMITEPEKSRPDVQNNPLLASAAPKQKSGTKPKNRLKRTPKKNNRKLTPVVARAAAADSAAVLSPEEARRKVIDSYRELPPDSVMTSFFD